ncbi:MAG: sulfurtransferase TusA [Marinomonas sp.]
MNHQVELDTTGLLCPEPVMMLHVEMRKMAAKEVLKVTATDPSTTRDIPKFCNFLGHTLAQKTVEEGVYYYWIQKKEG